MLHLLPPLLLGTDIQTIATSADFPEAVNGFAFPTSSAPMFYLARAVPSRSRSCKSEGARSPPVVTTGQKFSLGYVALGH